MSTSPEDRLVAEALAAAKEYADTILLQPLTELGGILTDTIGCWRLKNQVRLILKTKAWLQERDIDPTKVLPDILVPLLETAANTENTTLADMFATLLASHLNPETQESVHPSYARVLSELSPLDARLMTKFRRNTSDSQYRELGFRGNVFDIEFIASSLDIREHTVYLFCLNLHRLGIIDHTGFTSPAKHPLPEFFEDSMKHQTFRITEYGIALCDACYDCSQDMFGW